MKNPQTFILYFITDDLSIFLWYGSRWKSYFQSKCPENFFFPEKLIFFKDFLSYASTYLHWKSYSYFNIVIYFLFWIFFFFFSKRFIDTEGGWKKSKILEKGRVNINLVRNGLQENKDIVQEKIKSPDRYVKHIRDLCATSVIWYSEMVSSPFRLFKLQL